MIKYILTHEERDCCGCGACADICPQKCISMKYNEDGFAFPDLDNEMCVNCGKCEKTCPMENNDETIKKPENVVAYAIYSKDDNVILKSSSGGVFSTIAKSILRDDGIVFGASLENREVRTIGIEKEEDLYKIQGSKYIQSDTENCFSKIKDNPESGKKVFYTATPCQVSALKKFLGRDYDNLYTADFICHGVPSNLIFKKYVEFLEDKHKGELTDINFRDKERYGWSITLRYDIRKNGKVKRYYVPSKLSEYFTAFLRGYILRESCYNCPRANLNRAGDLTFGDYWGYQKVLPEIKNTKGLSIVLVNSEKGGNMISLLEKEKCFVKKLTKKESMVEENINLFRPTPRPDIRSKTYKELHAEGFKVIAKRYFSCSKTPKEIIKSKLPQKVLEYIKNKRQNKS